MCAILTAGLDYNIPSPSQDNRVINITIPANTTEVPIPIEILDDNILERSETFRLNVKIPQATAQFGLAEGPIPSTKVTINNDDSECLWHRRNTSPSSLSCVGPCRNVTPCDGIVLVPVRSVDGCSVCAVWQAGPYGNVSN